MEQNEHDQRAKETLASWQQASEQCPRTPCEETGPSTPVPLLEALETADAAAHERVVKEVAAYVQGKITLAIERLRHEVSQGRGSLVPYGFRLDAGAITDHRVEMPVLRVILGKRLEGISLRGIAQWLDEQGVPTRRNKGKGWHSQVVKLIVDRMLSIPASGPMTLFSWEAVPLSRRGQHD